LFIVAHQRTRHHDLDSAVGDMFMVGVECFLSLGRNIGLVEGVDGKQQLIVPPN